METQKTKTPAPAKKQPAAEKSTGYLAMILVRGVINAKEDIIITMDKFLLRQKLACSVYPNTPANKKAAMKIKDYVTFGEISEETYKELIAKRGEKDAEGKVKKYFRLHPPRGGFERKGIKVPFTRGGAIGYRGDKMNDLIKKML